MSVHTAFQDYMISKNEKQLLTMFCVFIEGDNIVYSEHTMGVACTKTFQDVDRPNMAICVIHGKIDSGTLLSGILVFNLALQCKVQWFQRLS